MGTLLHLDSAVFSGEASSSRSATQAFVDAWRQQHPEGKVLYRDLDADPVPHISADAYMAAVIPAEQRSESQAINHAAREALIAELESADAVVIGAPMYNFGIPSTLKTWIDNVILIGRTSSTTESKILGTPVTVIASRGGSYAPGTPNESHEYVINYLESALGSLLGMQPRFIVIELTLAHVLPGLDHLIPVGEQSRNQGLSDAQAAGSDLARRLSA
ncbi:FMN-dependent NADH-azoreductase [Mycobacterium sp. NPDC003449]